MAKSAEDMLALLLAAVLFVGAFALGLSFMAGCACLLALLVQFVIEGLFAYTLPYWPTVGAVCLVWLVACVFSRK